MVGLPARGKSYIVKMIMRYLRWTGIKAEIFNVGNHRRKAGAAAGRCRDSPSHSTGSRGTICRRWFDFTVFPPVPTVPANFFDKDNLEAQKQREQLALDVQVPRAWRGVWEGRLAVQAKRRFTSARGGDSISLGGGSS